MLQSSLIPPKPYAQPVAGSHSDRWPAVAVCSGLFLGVLLLFCRCPWQGYFNIDDNLYITGEPAVAGGLTWSSIPWVFSNGPLGEWYPLTMLTHMLDCTIFGVDHPGGAHAVNVLIHAAAAVILFLALWRMTGGLWPSAMVAALFAIHPLHVEPVVWLAQRRDVLSALFFALTLWAYDGYTRQPDSPWRFPLVALMLGLGLLSKPILVTMPALLLLLDYWPLGRLLSEPLPEASAAVRPRVSIGRLILEKVPLTGLSLIVAIMTMRTHGMLPDSLKFSERLTEAIYACAAYLGQMFVPIHMSIFYAHPETGRPLSHVLVALALLVVISVLAVVWYRKYPYFFVGWFWYLGMLVPVSGLVFVGPQARGDRYTYLSQIGLFVALVWAATALSARWEARRLVFSVGSAVLLLALFVISWRQATLWQSNVEVWKHAVECQPKSATCHCLLGTVLEDEGENEAAIGEFAKAIELPPRTRNIYGWARAKAHYRLAGFALRAGIRLDAIGHLKKALDFDPTYERADFDLGPLLARQGLLDEAIVCFQRCIDRNTDGKAMFMNNLATALTVQKKDEEAIAVFKEALAIDPKLSMTHFNYGRLLESHNQIDEAIEQYRQVVELEPDNRLPYFQLARLLRHQGRDDEADKVDADRVACDRRSAENLNQRGVELAEEGKYGDAVGLFQSALSTSPSFAEARLNMAAALEKQGDLNAAAVEYRRALEMDPSLTSAKEALARLQR